VGSDADEEMTYMPVEMAIWRMGDKGPVPLGFAALDLEQRLEDMLVEDPSLVGLDLLVLGRQVPTSFGGFVDMLGIDSDAHLHVLELKRDRTPRDVVAQTLDYGSWAQGLTLADVEEIYEASHANGEPRFEDAFADRFNQPLPDVVNADQQLTVVASELDPVSDRIVEYLAERYGVPINAVFFRHFVDGASEYLARTWLLRPDEASIAQSRAARTSKSRAWNGRDYYVILGNVQQGEGRWDVAQRYGMLNAGGGAWYWKPLRNLAPGNRVFAYVGGAGYVGIGIVEGPLQPFREAVVAVDGEECRLVECRDVPSALRDRALSEDPDVTEFVVPVRWLEARPAERAVSEPGLFASQVTVCKLRDERTIEAVERALGLQAERHSAGNG
jgi:Endonuclease NucS